MNYNDLAAQDKFQYPMLANALNGFSMSSAELNEWYKSWDPYAYEQWIMYQNQQQVSYMNGLLASAFTRSRPLNYESSSGKVYQWETLLPIIPKPLFIEQVDTIDLTSDEEAEIHAHALERMNPRHSSVITACTTQPESDASECSSPLTKPVAEEQIATATRSASDRTTPASSMTAQPATELKRIDKQQARIAFRIFIRQNYRFIKRMLGDRYSKDNLQYSYSKWWRRMIPAGRGFYQVMAKRSVRHEAATVAAGTATAAVTATETVTEATSVGEVKVEVATGV